jgi:hypothetical protein
VILALLLACAAGAAPRRIPNPPGEPEWVAHYAYEPQDAPGPPTTDCESSYKVKAPKAEQVDTEAPTTSSTPTPEAAPIATMDVGGPFDVSQVPLEPIRGRDADIARLRAVVDMAARGDGTTRISFFGASHVAGEFLTGHLRRLFQERWGDGGHGYVTAGPPWKGYRASDLNLCASGTWMSDFVDRRDGRGNGRYGPAGIVTWPGELPAFSWVQTTKSNPQGRAVSRYEVAFLRQPEGGELVVQVDGQTARPISTDGPTGPGLAVLHVPDGPHRLQLSAIGKVEIFGTWMERDAPGVVVDAAGVPGRTAMSWMAWDTALVAPYLERRPPDLIVLAYGTNEANDRSLTPEAYASDLRRVLDRMRRMLPDAACLLVGPSDRGKKVSKSSYGVWPATEWVARVQREVGPEFACATWDLQAAMGGPGSMLRGYFGADPKLGAGDLIHFSAAGYQEAARRLASALTGDPAFMTPAQPPP